MSESGGEFSPSSKRPPFSTTVSILAVSHSIAFLTTFLRLWQRSRTRKLWWDDFWAFVALLSDMFVWILYVVIPIQDLLSKPLGIQIFWKFGTILVYTLGLWSARVSIAVTIVRLINESLFRTIAKAVVVLFVVFWLTLSIQKIFICGTRWHEVPDCRLPRVTAYIELATDAIGDMWLLCSPVILLWKMKLSRRHRRLLIAIFSCSIFITFASIAHAYFIVVRIPPWVGITAHIQLGVAVTVCNLLVLITRIYSVFYDTTSQTRTETTESNPSRPSHDPNNPSNPPPTFESRRSIVTLTDLGSNFGNTQRTAPSRRLYSTFSYPTSDLLSADLDHVTQTASRTSSASTKERPVDSEKSSSTLS
ncbi:hypothetical protein NLJ89_g7785 [Agrocybe chaxingu]|uniref:Rhodopsin domain-containing protein n=1 Tax=Agrocybe chaxingu TaxID=84603 RepID=A0A9W8JW47_9AGAR|nr:hypothetical protein NLJ89_g7785 [Agrocybe chaxingu]